MGTVKLTVSLSDEVVDALKDMARNDGTSVTEQLRRAVSIQKWLYDVRKRNARVLVEEPTGETQRIQFVH